MENKSIVGGAAEPTMVKKKSVRIMEDKNTNNNTSDNSPSEGEVSFADEGQTKWVEFCLKCCKLSFFLAQKFFFF